MNETTKQQIFDDMTNRVRADFFVSLTDLSKCFANSEETRIKGLMVFCLIKHHDFTKKDINQFMAVKNVEKAYILGKNQVYNSLKKLKLAGEIG